MNSINQASRGGRTTLRRVLKEHDTDQRRLSIRGEGGIRVRLSNGRLVLGAALTGLNLSRFAFGWLGANDTDLPQTVEIRRGYVSFRGQFGEVAARRVTVAGNANTPHVIYAYGTTALDGQVAASSVQLSSFTGHTIDQWRVPLFICWLHNGRPRLGEILHVGLIDLGP